MPSPFPGMDPWLEAPGLFPDVHNSLIAYLREAIADKLPPPYYSAIASRMYIEDSDRQIEPDIHVLHSPKRGEPEPRTTITPGVQTLPIVIQVQPIEHTEWTLEIRDASSGDRLVSSIEILSPSNKRAKSKGRRLYISKRRELFRGRVNTIEIDLLRAGVHSSAIPAASLHSQVGLADYHVCVHRAQNPNLYEIYPWPLEQALPAIRVPLLPESDDVVVELQPLLNHCYDIGRFQLRIDYTQPPEPPLNAEQQAWAAAILQTSHPIP